MKTAKKIQITITVAAVAIALVHVIWPTLSIDAITLALVVIAIVPWLSPLFKSIELPGGTKIEFRELKKAEKEAKESGLIGSVRSLAPVT